MTHRAGQTMRRLIVLVGFLCIIVTGCQTSAKASCTMLWVGGRFNGLTWQTPFCTETTPNYGSVAYCSQGGEPFRPCNPRYTAAPAEPGTGPMWAYSGDSQSIPSLHVIAYAANRPTCEVSRAKDMKPSPNAAWADLKVSTECRRATVSPGTAFWVFGYHGSGGIGASERDWCEKLRENLALKRPALGTCQPMNVEFLP